MTIPPTRPSSTPPSGESGRPEDKKVRKDFKLPAKDVKEDEKKKKGLFEIAGEGQVKEMKQQVSESAAELKTEASSAITAKAQVTQIGQLIQKMVSQMQIGTANGKTFASLELAKTADVPQAFAGSNLTLSYQENGLVIRFDNFMSPQQQNNAFTLVEMNKEQLTQMIQTLQAKNIQVAELNIGDRRVALPQVQPLPPPFQPQQGSSAESRRDRGGDEGQQKREHGGPTGPRRV